MFVVKLGQALLVVGVLSLLIDGSGSPPQVMDFVSVLMHFLLIWGGSGGFPLSMAQKNWFLYCSPAGVRYDESLAESISVGSSHSCFALAFICV